MTENPLCCNLNDGKKDSVVSGETIKERNRRLLAKERESLCQKKSRTSKQRGKCLKRTNILPKIDNENTGTAEVQDAKRVQGRAENIRSPRESVTVDRW